MDHGVLPPSSERSAETLFFAMDLLPGGSVHARMPYSAWPLVRSLLLAAGSGLAFAHGHGLIHGGLTPRSLMCGTVPPDWRVTDLGTAPPRPADLTYAAPEQLAPGATATPATDLYALACIVWELTTGRPPFRGTPAELEAAHLGAEPPAYHPLFRLPARLEGWLRALLRKDPGDRPTCVADALAAHLDRARIAPGARIVEAPFPADWRRAPWEPPSRDRPPPRPIWTLPSGAALPLPPLTGRQPQRDALWELLRRARAAQQPQGAVIVSHLGGGASRLARWLAHRSEELGTAWMLVVGGRGAERELPPADFVHKRAHERAVVVVVEDFALDPDRAAWLEALLAHDRGAALVVVGTVSLPLGSAQAAARVRSALAVPGVLRIDLGPLAPAPWDDLLVRGLGLSDDLSRSLWARTGGNAGLGLEAVAWWAREGALVLGPRGAALQAPHPHPAGRAPAGAHLARGGAPARARGPSVARARSGMG